MELENVIADRLRRRGEDVSSASVLAAVAWSVGCAVFRQWLEGGTKAVLSVQLERALSGIRAVL